MLHTKSFIRRLAYVPWLLVLGLVVGWTGTAEAVGITLSLNKPEVREDNGNTEISVTAKSDSPTSAPIHVVLSYTSPADPLNQRFRMSVPTLIIPKADKVANAKVTGTISFIPTQDKFRGAHGNYQDNGLLDDLTITITGQAGVGNTVSSTELKLIDDDKLTRNLKLRFSPGNLNKEDEEHNVDVIAYVDGARLSSKHTFDVVFKNTVGDDRNDLFDKTPATLAAADGKNILVRDSEYRSTTTKINLSRRKKEASGTITLDPFNVPGHVAVEATFPESQAGRIADDDGTFPTAEPTVGTPGEANSSSGVYHLDRFAGDSDQRLPSADSRNFLMAKGIDFNSDGDTGDVIVLTADGTPVDNTKLPQTQDGTVDPTDPGTYYLKNPSIGKLTEKNMNLDFDGDGTIEMPTRETSGVRNYNNDGVVSETALGIDVDNNGALGNVSDMILKDEDTAAPTAANLFDSENVVTSLVEKDALFGVMVRAGFFQIKDLPSQIVKEVKIVPGSMREEEGTKTFDVNITLTRKRPEPSILRFEIEDGTESDADCGDCAGIRDIDYTADIEPLTIAANVDKGTTKITITSKDNDVEDEAKVFQLKARLGSETPATTLFTISDDELPSTKVTLTAEPGTITSGDGEQEVQLTATLNGKVFDEDLKLTLILDHNRESPTRTTAERDIDFDASVSPLTIKAGEVSGTETVFVTGIPKATGNLKIGLTALETTRKDDGTRILKTKNEDEEDIVLDGVAITLKPAPAAETEPDEIELADLSVTAYKFTAGMAVSEELPEAAGASAAARYSVSSNLPAGLAFDSATRMISGTPTAAAEATEIVYTVIDDGKNAATLFTVEIAPEPAPTVTVSKVELSQTSVREGSETVEIAVKATLADTAEVAETIRFTLATSDAGTAAVRDADYTASLVGNVPIEVGATQASTTLTLTAVDNDAEDGNRFLAVQAKASGGSASEDIKIADDETASTSILLSATPNTVSEGDGETNVTITASLDGKVMDADASVVISIDAASSATRDEDYVSLFIDSDGIVEPIITIPANSVSGSIILRLAPAKDGEDEGNESITLTGSTDGLASGSATITLADYKPDDETMTPPLAFAEGTTIADIEATAGTEIDATELPAAAGGSGDISYSVSDLPAGLSFDADTRTLSGTPEAAGTTEVTYTATDGDGATAELTFSIMVNPELDFGDVGSLFGALNGGAGKANPASEHDAGNQWVVDHPISTIQVPDDATLQQLGGGTPPYTLSVSGLPAGVSFDSATRKIAGTPSEVGAVVVTITVTDANGASASLPPIGIQVVLPPLDAPDALVAEDYKGADGAGDQGGFILLTWDLSEHHDGIDGYRIFRELPVLGNEMVPWAMVDAVPGVSIGRAIVATLDNVATNWGIAAERGGQTTHGAAKAVFVSAENPYELMAETMMASMDAAQVGDAPMFASLLPEALAYAQGVAPRLNVVAGVLSSAITVTEEPGRAIDNIAPLAVPSFSVLDAPNDQGSRIVLTWTLSPSDQVLQDVVTGAIGPLGAEPVVGVHGYSIYRRAAGEDEFVRIAQVERGMTSFVDETALNGVRYTYQVLAYDLDNETGSEIEQTAMAVRNIAVDSDGRTILGLFGADNRIGFDDFFIFADNFGLTEEDAGFDPAFDLAPSAQIDFEDFFVFADNFGRSIAAAGKRVPMFAGLNADARMYLDARTAMPNVGEDFVLDVRLADFVAVKGYGLQVQYEADKLEFVEVLTDDQPLGGSELAAPQVLADQAGVLTVAAHGDVVSDGEVMLSLIFRATTEIENTVVEITDNQTYDSAFGFNRLALPAPVQLQTRPEAFALANNYPNPFNPATTIKYALPQAADVQLTVYNVLGQPVRTLVAEHQNAGRYVVEWDATNDSGHNLSSGMYFYRLEAGGDLEVKKMLLLK